MARPFTRPAAIAAQPPGLRVGAWLRASFASRETRAFLAFAALLGLSAYRARIVNAAYATYAGCSGCLDTSVLANDAYVLALFAALVALARLPLPYAFKTALAFCGTLAVAIFAADIVLLRLLSQRLLVADVLKFSGDALLLTTVVVPWLVEREGALAMAGCIATCALAWSALMAEARSPETTSSSAPMRWLAASVALVAAAIFLPRAEYVHHLAMKNVWQVNQEVDASRPYSREFFQLYGELPAAAMSCETGLARRPSVVLVVVESLSAQHSKLFSGLHDYTPRLDAIAANASYFSAFHANGFSTEGGLIALLTGYVPIPTAGRRGSTLAFTQVDHDFHRAIAERGYTTAFFTSGDLAIGHRREWLQKIGIAYAEGAENAHYRGMRRGSFGAADDAALVDRFLLWHAAEPPGRPFMATLLTVGSHPPFVSPERGVIGEAEAIREADLQVGRLVEALRKRGFLQDNIVIIVGDHRVMTPVPRAEFEALGPSAMVRIPAIALGATGLPRGDIGGAFQQTDLIASLRHMTMPRTCREEWRGRFLGSPPAPPRYVVHSDPLRRNELSVIERGGNLYRLTLDGDDTRWEIPPPRLEQAEALLQQLNYERMARMSEFGAPGPRTPREPPASRQ